MHFDYHAIFSFFITSLFLFNFVSPGRTKVPLPLSTLSNVFVVWFVSDCSEASLYLSSWFARRRTSLMPARATLTRRPSLPTPERETAGRRRCSPMAARAAATRPRHCSSPPALVHVFTRRRSSPSRRGYLRVPPQLAVGACPLLADACACQRSSLRVLAHACARQHSSPSPACVGAARPATCWRSGWR